MHRIPLLIAVCLLILSACVSPPLITQQPAQIRVETPASAGETTTPTPLPTQGVTDTPIPAPTPTPQPTQDVGRLDQAAAQGFLETWFRQHVGPLEDELPVEETTPQEVWEQLRLQIFRIREPGALYDHTYLVRDRQAWPLNTSFDGQGVRPENMLVADLEQDGSPELVYVFAYDVDVEQATRIGVFRGVDSQVSLLELDFVYQGRLGLQKDKKRQVEVLGQPLGAEQSEMLGYLILQGKILALAEDPNQIERLARHESAHFAVSFQYPADWGKIAEDRFQGETGFFELAPYPTVASGLTDVYEGWSFGLVRACDWEVNSEPGRYGQDPEVKMILVDTLAARCQILAGEGARETRSALMFKAPTGGFAILQADPRHLEIINQTIEFQFPGGQPPVEGRAFAGPEGVPPELTLETRQFGDLTLEEYSLFPDDVHTPGDPEILQRALSEVLASRAAWRKTYWDLSWSERMVVNNAILEPFGYRLEIQPGAEEERLNLYGDGALVKDGLSMWWPAIASSEDRRGDFALVMSEVGASFTNLHLIRKDRIEPWDMDRHLWVPPVFVGGRLATVEVNHGGRSSQVLVKLDGETVYTYLSSLGNARGEAINVTLGSWQNHWVLEIDGTLVENGELLNPKIGYGEIFGWRLLDGKPFFFFEKGGKFSLSYAGQELPVKYDEVIHGWCCLGGELNLHGNEHMAWFYARRDGMWYYVEIGIYAE